MGTLGIGRLDIASIEFGILRYVTIERLLNKFLHFLFSTKIFHCYLRINEFKNMTMPKFQCTHHIHGFFHFLPLIISIYNTPGSLGAKKEVKDQFGRTSVHYAAFFNKLKSLKYLLQSASDWSCIDAFGRTPLHWSCANKSVKALKQLLSYANSVLAQTEYIDFEGTTPVFVAVQYCNAQHIELLAKEGEFSCDIYFN